MKLSLWNVWKNNFYVRTVVVERLIVLRHKFFEYAENYKKENGSWPSGLSFAINELQLSICEIRGDPESHWKPKEEKENANKS